VTAVGYADDAPPDAELLEFIGEWGESAPLVDAAEDASVQAPTSPPPPPAQADHADP
jgi:hypothetical protein